MLLVSVGGRNYRYLIKTVSSEDGGGELEQLIKVYSNLATAVRAFQTRLPQGFFISEKVVEDLVRQAIKDGWDPQVRGTIFSLRWRSVSNVP